MGKLAANETASVTISLQANTHSQQITLLQCRATDADEHAQVRRVGLGGGALAGGRGCGAGEGRWWHGGVARGSHGGGHGAATA